MHLCTQPVYEVVQSYLDVDTRVDVLNQRLDIIRELYVEKEATFSKERTN